MAICLSIWCWLSPEGPHDQVSGGLPLTCLKTQWQRPLLSDFCYCHSHWSSYLSGHNEGLTCPVCLLRAPMAAFAQWTSSKEVFLLQHYGSIRNKPIIVSSAHLFTCEVSIFIEHLLLCFQFNPIFQICFSYLPTRSSNLRFKSK